MENEQICLFVHYLLFKSIKPFYETPIHRQAWQKTKNADL